MGIKIHIGSGGTAYAWKVMLDGIEHDFSRKFNGKLMYRESSHFGESFAPISDSPRYKPEVRKVVREVVAEMDKVQF